MTGKINNYFNGNPEAIDAIKFGTESDYNMDFPEKLVMEELQSGAVGGGRFTASKFKIESIESMASVDWESNIIITTDVNDDGIITTNPKIVEENMKDHIDLLFLTKEITHQITNALSVIDMDQVQNIVGSGKNIKVSILDICRNGKVLLMDADIYELYKRNIASFKETTIILFNDKDGFSIDSKKGLTVHIPDVFSVNGCAVINEKGSHICLGKKEYIYDEKSVIVPLVYEHKVLSEKNKIVIEWLKNVIKKYSDENIQYVALFTLPFLCGELKNFKEELFRRWNKMEFSEIVSELDKIHRACILLKTEMFQIDVYADLLVSKIDFTEYENALQSIKSLMATDVICKNSDSHRKMIEAFINHITPPDSYRNLYMLLQALGITTHDEALAFDDLIGDLYTKTIMTDIISTIAEGIFTKMPELFEYDVFFNEYQECVSEIELLVSGLKLFEKNNIFSVKESVQSCQDIASLQSYIAELRSKNTYLLKIYNINIDEVLKKTLPKPAEAFTENLRRLEKYTEQVVTEAYSQTDITWDKEITLKRNCEQRKIFILDTCALMHHPDLFMYFADDEYVRIPTKVIDELGKIKDKRNKKYGVEFSDKARLIAREIERTYLKLFNKENKVRLMVENSAPELLPRDLDKDVPDNQILSVALKYKDWETYIVSDDGVFRLAAMAQHIAAINSEEFIEKHKETYKSLENRIKEYNANGTTSQINKAAEKQTMGKEKAKLDFVSDALVDKMKAVVGSSILAGDIKSDENEGNREENLKIDALSIRELKKYISDFNESVFVYLQSNHINTVGEFRHLTESKVRNMPAKGKQMVYKNTIIQAVKQMDTIIAKIKL